MKTLAQLHNWYGLQLDNGRPECLINRELLGKVISGQCPQELYLEYLAICLGDVMDCLEEALNGE